MALLEVNDLRTSFFTERGEIPAVRGVSFSLEAGEVLGIVGESGSGKSVTAYSVMQILSRGGRIVGGSVKLSGKELIGCTEDELKNIRGNRISIIFQDPMTSLNPTYTVGFQLEEAIRLHTDRDRRQAAARALEMLKLVNISDPERRIKQYPFELSGGMRQRVMIAMALACEPDILIADEPTTALDVTIQAEILALMRSLQKQLGMAIIMITHDLGVIAELCDRVIVMYAGKICEAASTEELFYHPSHEYTKGLIRSLPRSDSRGKPLTPIKGSPPDLTDLPRGCPFVPRCSEAMRICRDSFPYTVSISETHTANCWVNQREAMRKAGGGFEGR